MVINAVKGCKNMPINIVTEVSGALVAGEAVAGEAVAGEAVGTDKGAPIRGAELGKALTGLAIYKYKKIKNNDSNYF